MSVYFDTNVYLDALERSEAIGEEILGYQPIVLSEESLYELGAPLYRQEDLPRLATIEKLVNRCNILIVPGIDLIIQNERIALQARSIPKPMIQPMDDIQRRAVLSTAKRLAKGTPSENDHEVWGKRARLKDASHRPWIEQSRRENAQFVGHLQSVHDVLKFANAYDLAQAVHGGALTVSDVSFLKEHLTSYPLTLASMIAHCEVTYRSLDGDGLFSHDRLDDIRHIIAASYADDFVSGDKKLRSAAIRLGRLNIYSPAEYIAKFR